MADETHKLQKDPPEGSRKVIDHELARQSGEHGENEDQAGSAADKERTGGSERAKGGTGR